MLAAALLAVVGTCGAAADAGEETVRREVIPGSELLTHGERERYRRRMRGAKSADEEARVRDEHLRMVRERARLRGLRLADPADAKAQR